MINTTGELILLILVSTLCVAVVIAVSAVAYGVIKTIRMRQKPPTDYKFGEHE